MAAELRRIGWRLALGLSLSLFAGVGSAAAGQSATVDAQRLEAVPAGAAVAVEIYDDSELNLEVREAFVSALEARGVPVEAAARLRVMLDLQLREGRLEETAPSLGRSHSDTQETEVEVNVLSSSQDSLLGGQRSEPGTRVVREGVVSLEAQLRDRAGGPVLWTGRARTTDDARGFERLAPMLAAPLAEAYGETVGPYSVSLAP
jgi:hypothetical protein